MTMTMRIAATYEVVALSLSFSIEDLKSAFAKDSYAVVTLLSNGKLILGYPEGDVPFVTKISLNPKTKTFHIKAVGNKVTPRDQAILNTLKNKGMIDSSWKASTQGGFDKISEELEDFDFATDPRNSFSRKLLSKFKLYHGTTNIDYEKIKKTGLISLDKSGARPGFESRVKHEGNAGVLYLASTFDSALAYAKTRSSSLKNGLAKKAGYQILNELDMPFVLRNPETKEILKIYPIVLEVTVPDMARLVADDDHINDKAREIAREMFDNFTPEEIEDARKLAAADRPDLKDWLNEPSKIQMIWRETSNGFAAIMKKVPDKLYHEWFESLERNGQVGYKGIITPKFLKKMPTRYDDD